MSRPDVAAAAEAAPAAAVLDLDAAYRISPQVSVRPESFGALLYHFGTRRLSFLKDRRLLDVVQRLEAAPSARAACRAAGLGEQELERYAGALSTLVATDMVRRRPSTDRAVGPVLAPELSA